MSDSFLKAFKDPGRTTSHVYLRDSEDTSLQLKADVFKINYDAQEAELGLYPRRWGRFSHIHLPHVYRVVVPLTELSLEPHAGAAQVGYEDILLQRSPAEAVPWMDHAGRTHAPGCADPDAPKDNATVAVGEDGVPEFGGEASAAISAAAQAILRDPKAREIAGAAPITPMQAQADADQAAFYAAQEVAAAKLSKSKPPLFTKAEILARISDVEESLMKLRSMVDKVLE